MKILPQKIYKFSCSIVNGMQKSFFSLIQSSILSYLNGTMSQKYYLNQCGMAMSSVIDNVVWSELCHMAESMVFKVMK